MYALYKELHPPTSVDHCVSCRFTSETDANVITASGHVLRVYKVRKVKSASGGQESWKLEYMFENRLLDAIISLGATRLAKSTRDALLLGFREAKLSVVQFDPEVHDIHTVSLHYFEDEESKFGTSSVHTSPVVAVDPDYRCAAMLIYGTKLVVLPYQRDEMAVDKKFSPSHSSVFPSYTIDLKTVATSDHIAQVKDVQFLHGYNKPTISILYETTPTWAGRIATFKDNFSFLAMTLDTSSKLHAVIWTQKGLPYDSFSLLPVPKPLGGVLVLAVNSLTYFSPSYPHFGVSLNNMAEKSSSFAFRSQCPHVLTLDGSKACFLTSDKLMVVMRNGQIYILSLITESPGMDLVRNISFELATSTVQPSCVCRIGEDFVFLGSHCGNSVLLNCCRTVEALEPKVKKKKVVDTLELDLFGETQSLSQSMSFHFKVCDSIVNIGPIGSMTIGEPEETSEEYLGNLHNPSMEVVTCSGHGRSGALSVLQRGVKPHVVSTFELPGHDDMFTLLESPNQDGSTSDVHSYLLLSGSSGTMVLQTGEEIAELGQSGFVTDQCTIGAGNIGNCRYNVQVTSQSVVLLEGANIVQQLSIESGLSVHSCSISDPYIVLLLSNSSLQLITLECGTMDVESEQDQSVRITSASPTIDQPSKITCVATYTDKSGIFSTSAPSAVDRSSVVVKKEPIHSEDRSRSDSYSRLTSTLDDEDEMLYGSSSQPTAVTTTQVNMEQSKSVEDADDLFRGEDTDSVELTHWCAVTYESGALEVFKLPQFESVFFVRTFTVGSKVLKDSLPLSSPVKMVTPTYNVRDLLVIGMGPNEEYPYIISVVDEEVLMYRAFQSPNPNDTGRLQIHFIKESHDVVVREKKSVKLHQGEVVADRSSGPSPFIRVLRPFRDVSVYSGVFICGAYPHWLVMSSKGCLCAHPMYIDGPVDTFTMFNNQNCPKGFLYFNQEGELRICVLPKYVHYDLHWPTHKVPLKATPHFVAYHPEAKVHAVVTGEAFPVKQLPVISNDDIEGMEPVERDSRFPYPSDEKFQLKLYIPGTWEPAPKCNVKFDDFEHVTCMKVASLRSVDMVSGKKDYIIVSTCDVRTEEVSSKGKVYILDVAKESGSSDANGSSDASKKTKIELQLAGSKEVKSPVTCLEAIDSHLLGCVCQKIYIWQFKNKEINAVAFIDTDVYIHTVSVLKNFILVADIMKNVKLLRFKNDLKSLSLISRDPFSSNVYTVGFVVDGDQLGFVATDAQCNISIYQYQPEIPESFGGRHLHRRCDFNNSNVINCLHRVRCKPSVSQSKGKDPKWTALEKRHVTYFATVDGGIGFILPVPERMYRRLNMLQTKMTQGFSHPAGLNPKASRSYQSSYKLHSNPQRNMLDGELLWGYCNLSMTEKVLLAKQIGTEVHQILQDMMDVSRNTCHF